MSGILVAGIGNIFKGDDGFGVAVAQRLLARSLPPDIHVVDFGIRSFDLAYALSEGHAAAILIDAVRRGAAPGTLYIIDPDPQDAGEPPETAPAAHAMEPLAVLRLAEQLGGRCRRILLVGCEAESFGDDEFGMMALTPGVAAAVGHAADMVEGLARDLIRELQQEIG